MRFINAELTKIGRDPIPPARVVDTLALGRGENIRALQPVSMRSCDRYRIDRSRRIKHGALLDAEILVEVYSELLGGRQRSMIFARKRALDSVAKRIAIAARKARGASLAPLLTEAEILAHAEHIAKLGDSAFWRRHPSAPKMEKSRALSAAFRCA